MKNKRSFAALGFMIIIALLMVGGRVVYFSFYCYILIILIGKLYIKIGKKKITGSIKLPSAEIISGEKISISYAVKNESSFLFPFLELNSSIEESLSGNKKKIKVFSLSGNSKYVENSEIVCNRRGYYKTGEAYIVIRDIFNIFSIKKKIHEAISLKVYPRVMPISYFGIFGNLQMGELMVKNPIFEDYSSLSDLRFYRDGDSVKRIDWKISAKKDDLIVKLHDLRGDTEVAILINSSADDYIYDENRAVEDRAVEIAISIVDFCLERNIKVSLTSEDGYYNGRIKGDSKLYLKMFLENLIEFSPKEGKRFFSEISNFGASSKQGLTSLIITPKLSNEEGILIANMKMKNINPVIILLNGEKESKFSKGNREISKKLKNENVPIYLVDMDEHFGNLLEEENEKLI